MTDTSNDAFDDLIFVCRTNVAKTVNWSMFAVLMVTLMFVTFLVGHFFISWRRMVNSDDDENGHQQLISPKFIYITMAANIFIILRTCGHSIFVMACIQEIPFLFFFGQGLSIISFQWAMLLVLITFILRLYSVFKDTSYEYSRNTFIIITGILVLWVIVSFFATIIICSEPSSRMVSPAILAATIIFIIVATVTLVLFLNGLGQVE